MSVGETLYQEKRTKILSEFRLISRERGIHSMDSLPVGSWVRSQAAVKIVSPLMSSRWSLPALAMVVGSVGVIGGAWGKRAISEFGGPAIARVRLLNESGGLDSQPLCCMNQGLSLRVRNDSLWKTAGISTIRSSCGCVAVGHWPGKIIAGADGEIGVGVSPGPYENRVSVTLTLVGNDGETHAIPVAGAVLPPFAGWPQWAEGTRVEGRVEVVIDPRYLDLVDQALMFSKTNEPIGVEFDRARGLVTADAGE